MNQPPNTHFVSASLSGRTAAAPNVSGPVICYQRLAALIARRATPALAGTGLLLTGMAQAATFNPTTPAELISDITTANSNGEADTIDLGGNTFTLTTVGGTTEGDNGLPSVLADGGNALSIQNGIIERDSGAPAFRLIHVTASGDLTLNDVTLQGGLTSGTGTGYDTQGGGIFNRGNLTLTDSQILNNTATRNGGGVGSFRGRTITITNSTLSGNMADNSGGGIYVTGSIITVSNSTLSGNMAVRDGGGIFDSSSADLINSTVSNNTAGRNGGGILGAARFRVTHSTLTGNSATSGGGLFSSSGFQLTNSLVVNSTGGNCVSFGPDTNRANEANFDDDGTCVAAENDGTPNIIEDPDAGTLLGPLADDGGPTQTHALLVGSPAIDQAATSTELTDQRGFFRDATPDVGAFEFEALVPTLDFGDAPDPDFPTLLASNGARHATNNPAGSGPILGNLIDAETDGLPNATATGDDADNTNDEDGLVFTTLLLPGMDATAEVVVTQADGLLNAWVDFNADGDWDDAGEQVAADVTVTVAGSPNSIVFAVPDTTAGAVEGPSFARIRVSTAGGDGTTGLAVDGEVEDYPAFIGTPPQAVLDAIDDDDDGCEGSDYLLLCIGAMTSRDLLLLLPLALLGLWRKARAIQKAV